MERDDTTLVIGAGPYGLSVAAHLKARGIPTLVLGKSMEFWNNMPSDPDNESHSTRRGYIPRTE